MEVGKVFPKFIYRCKLPQNSQNIIGKGIDEDGGKDRGRRGGESSVNLGLFWRSRTIMKLW